MVINSLGTERMVVIIFIVLLMAIILDWLGVAVTVSDTDKMCQEGVTTRIGVDVCVFRWEWEKVARRMY